MSRAFDQTKLTPEDYNALFEAVKRGAWRDFEYGFEIPKNMFRTRYDVDFIAAQLTPATRESLEIVRRMIDERVTESPLEECVMIALKNPTVMIPMLRINENEVYVTGMHGYGPGNQYDCFVDFKEGEASLCEEDQDLAHKLGLIYTPKGMTAMFSLEASTSETHREKQQRDENSQPILYCDNMACQRTIRNPVLVVDESTGGVYHSMGICHVRDAMAKGDRGVNKFSPAYVSIEVARKFYEQGKLQQAPGFQTTL